MLLVFSVNAMANDDYDPIPGESEVDYEYLEWHNFGSKSNPFSYPDPFPPENWLLYSTNTEHTWEADSIAFDGEVYEDKLVFEIGSHSVGCFAFVEADGEGHYDEFLVSPLITRKKTKDIGCKDYFVYVPHIQRECVFSIEINQTDDTENSDNWYVIEDYSGVFWLNISNLTLFDAHFVRWRDDADFFDNSKGFRIGYRYKGKSCAGVAMPQTVIGCYYDYFDPDDYNDGVSEWKPPFNKDDDQDCSCGASGSGPNMLPALIMIFIGTVIYLRKGRNSRRRKSTGDL